MNSSSILSTLSPGDQNRITAWHNSLNDSLNYLHVGNYLDQLSELDTRYHIYQAFEGHTHRVHISETARQGLTESALIALFQVFKSGRSGYGVASNRNLKSVRDKMRIYVNDQLTWTEKHYESIYQTLEQQRDQLTAHYDGEAAGFKKINSALKTMALRGVHLSQDERADFMSLATKMYEFVHKVITNQI